MVVPYDLLVPIAEKGISQLSKETIQQIVASFEVK
jgi:hypothetical protein